MLRAIKVRFYPSSKTCHCCGYKKVDLTLKDREWTCPVCRTRHDRDVNAAMNILLEGKRIIGSRTTELTLVDCPTMDDKVETPLRSSDRLKQEVSNTNFS